MSEPTDKFTLPDDAMLDMVMPDGTIVKTEADAKAYAARRTLERKTAEANKGSTK